MSLRHVSTSWTLLYSHINPDGTLTTDLYTKLTDSHNYLLYNSSHLVHCKTGLPYSQFHRIRRRYSNITDFDRNTSVLEHHFRRPDYPEDLIKKSQEKARNKDRETLLTDSSKKEANDKADNLFIITTHQSYSAGIKPAILKNWHHLTRSNDNKYIFDTKIVFG